MVRDARAYPPMRVDNEYGESSKSSNSPQGERDNPQLSGPAWYCLHVKSRKEPRVFKFLHDQGYRPFLPCVAPDDRVRKRVPLSNRPLFPGYLFVQVDVGRPKPQGFHPIRNTRGVLRIIGDREDGLPAAVPIALIEELRARVHADGGLIRIPKPPARTFVKGEGVPVLKGAFAGHVGLFDELYVEGEETRITLLLDIMGGWQPITFPLSDVAPE